MRVLILSTWRAGLRGKSVQVVLMIAILLVAVAFLASFFSPRQPQTVALDVGLSGIRFSLVLFALFWVEQLLSREIGNKGGVMILAFPVPRSRYIISRYIGILALLALSSLLLGLMLWLVVFFSRANNYEQGFSLLLGLPYWLTVLGIFFDTCVVAAFAVMIASLATVPMLPIALGLAFAFAGKSLGAVLDYMAQGADGDPDILKMSPILDMLQYVLPDLSRFDWRIWPMYGVAPETGTVLLTCLMGAAYAVAGLSVAIRFFSRREFQ